MTPLLLAASLPLATPQDPAPGISLELARERAQRVSELRYRLHFDLAPGTGAVSGRARIEFVLPGADAPRTLPRSDLVLDFAGEEIDEVRINELEPDGGVPEANGHLVLPGEALNPGRNSFDATFRSKVAPTGTPLTVYADPVDGEEYWYTLVVPADAHRLYPCFDQPDLKARFSLSLGLPPGWTAVANAPEREDSREAPGDSPAATVYRFEETEPLSTYVMAFAAGPFHVVSGPTVGEQRMRLFVRSRRLEELEAGELFSMHHRSLEWLASWFQVPYPFAKLDLVLLPGFPYGGMEHAGAIFYRERNLVFDHPPTDPELTRRSTLIYHEVSHQWFGNLVTMNWFDDLWLKEGFATFMGYKCLAELEPGKLAWLRFHQRVKPSAYRVDATPATVPIYQRLGNLADAKSNYGPIVYNKAPAVLRELHDRMGEDAFRTGVHRFLTEHAFDNASWQDLARALDAAAREDLTPWSQRWILSPSMPQVRVAWTTGDDGLVQRFEVHQRAVDGREGVWPLQLELLVWDAAGNRKTVAVSSREAVTEVAELEGEPAPACVLANPGDVAYGQFLLDPVSRDWLLDNLPEDALVRAVSLSALYETVREAQLDPARYAELVLGLLAEERDEENFGWLLATLGVAVHRYLTEDRAAPFATRIEELLMKRLLDEESGLELQMFRYLARHGRSEDALELCRAVVRGERTPPDVPPGLAYGRSDRFLAAAALLAAGEGREPIDRLARELADQDVGKDVFLAGAAAPDPEVKAAWFERYLQLETPPEQWIQDSLPYFHWPKQEKLTLPFLRPALEKVEWVKQNRRIFFMPAWIDAFVNGHSSTEALEIVHAFRDGSELPEDIRRKLVQSLDGLERAVRIRTRWAK